MPQETCVPVRFSPYRYLQTSPIPPWSVSERIVDPSESMTPCEQAQIRFSCQGTTEAGSTQPYCAESTSLVMSTLSEARPVAGGWSPPFSREVIPSWNTISTSAIGPSAVIARGKPPTNALLSQAVAGSAGPHQTVFGLVGPPAATIRFLKMSISVAFGVFAPES